MNQEKCEKIEALVNDQKRVLMFHPDGVWDRVISAHRSGPVSYQALLASGNPITLSDYPVCQFAVALEI
jgi:hypothetical protein